MVILWKLFYLFQDILICINISFNHSLGQQLNVFLRNNKPYCLKRPILRFLKSEDGLALPNFHHYYWTSNIIKLVYWTNYKPSDRYPHWLHTEIASSQSSLHCVICSQLPTAYKVSNNSIAINTIKIRLQFRKQYGLDRFK